MSEGWGWKGRSSVPRILYRGSGNLESDVAPSLLVCVDHFEAYEAFIKDSASLKNIYKTSDETEQALAAFDTQLKLAKTTKFEWKVASVMFGNGKRTAAQRQTKLASYLREWSQLALDGAEWVQPVLWAEVQDAASQTT